MLNVKLKLSNSHEYITVTSIQGHECNMKFTLKDFYRECDLRIRQNREHSGGYKGDCKARYCRITSGNIASKRPLQEFHEKYGVTFNNLLKHLRGHVYHEVFKKNERIHNAIARGINRGSINWRLVENTNNKQKAIDVLLKDGLEHLTPLVPHLSKDTDNPCGELKEMVGKASWKKFCRNSFTRNALISRYQWGDRTGNSLSHVIDTPSTILKYGSDNTITSYVDIAKYGNTSWIKASKPETYNDITLFSRMARDTINVEHQIKRLKDPTFLPRNLTIKESTIRSRVLYKYSFEKLKKRHDDLTRDYELMRDKASSQPILWIENVFNETRGGIEGIPFEILNTKLKIRTEGKQMRHCVGMYDDNVASGRYLVVHFGGDRPSTLGIHVEADDKGYITYEHNQHYHAFNEPVTDSVRNRAAQVLIQELNNGFLTDDYKGRSI